VRFRYAMKVGCEDVGRRVTVRVRLSSGTLGDVLGVLERCDEHTFEIRNQTGKLRRISRSDVVAAKVVPPAPPRR
jgi:hypothetical protein